ncbi:MAG: biotin transporter BioY [Candidatus Omnitrophica bacterium]|nr:biotin transporter BioY [Candidatus Omnitrophota bacterium]MBU4478091.1 biotin transporter BioY [Candidatus Omnitrophota bacterium]MCG2704155.1 biotin transporter BioY [Candidatus Omnitrophota bacterium]
MQKSTALYLGEKELVVNKSVVRAVGVILFFILTAAGAFIYIPLPFTPVPVTLQTFFVLLCAAFLKKQDGVLSQSAYLGFGAAGIPIFSGAQGGLLKLFGPTGGYLIGFVFCIGIVSGMLEFYRSRMRLTLAATAVSMGCGLFAIYLCGGLWLAISLRYSFAQVIMLGVLPFIPGELLKLTAAVLIYHKLKKRTQTLFN